MKRFFDGARSRMYNNDFTPEELQTMEGGRLLDQGLYGCLFTPQLLCKSNNKPGYKRSDTSPMISKLISKETALVEHSIGERIRRIPLWRNYFAVSESMCVPAQKQADRDVKHCEPLQTGLKQGQKLDSFRILSMKYGGTSLSNVRFNLDNFDLLAFVTHLLEGGALMTLHGVIHRDIHAKNIIVDSHNVPRIIDFNLSILDYQSADADMLAHTYSPTLMQLSPDYIIMNALYKNTRGLLYDRVVNDIVYKRQFTKKLGTILGWTTDYMRAQIDAFYAHMRNAHMRNAHTVHDSIFMHWFNEFWPTIDSWAIGANIIQLIMHLSQWPRFVAMYNAAKPRLLPILRGLCAIHPLERMDCVEALHILNPGNRIIAKYGVSWLSDAVATH